MARIKNSVILCLSLFISIIFYYLEMVHEYFFKIYSHALNKTPVFECNAWISLVFLFYFIVLIGVLIFWRKIVVTRRVRFYVYIIIPYVICLIAWYLTNYQMRKIHYRFPEDGIVPVTDFLIISYLMHGIFFIPLVAYTCDFLLSFMFCKNKKIPPG